MMEPLIDRLQKLLAVKSIVTLALTLVFCILCLKAMIDAGQFMAIYTMIIGFYFGTQLEKKQAETTLPAIEETQTTEGAE